MGDLLTESALERTVRKLKQENADLKRTLAAVEYMLRETTPFDPATHPWCVSARATREALLEQRGRLTPTHHGRST